MAEPKAFDREINVRTVRRFALFVLGLIAFSMALIWGVAGLVKKELPKEDPAPPPLEAARENPLPPEPRLQSSPPKDMQEFRSREDAVLKGYAWVDRAKGEAQIPIDRAIDIAAQNGLPVKYGNPTPAAPATGSAK